jgi:hypothetical protein
MMPQARPGSRSLATAVAFAVLAPLGGPRSTPAQNPREHAGVREPTKVVVFYAGVERYTDAALRKRNYFKEVKSVAEDANEVYGLLTSLPNADAKRSRLLLADETPAPVNYSAP